MEKDYEDLVRKLWAKSKAEGVTPAEKELLENKALEFMSKHQVAYVIKDGTTAEKALYFEVSFDDPWASKKSVLFGIIAKHFNCTVIKSHKGPYLVFGFDSDITSLEIMYSIIENQMMAELARVIVPANIHGRAYNSSWINGYMYKIQERLGEIKKHSVREAQTGYAVALRDRSTVVNQEVRKKFPSVVMKAGPRTSTYDAYAGGKKAGDRANFDTQNMMPAGKNLELR